MPAENATLTIAYPIDAELLNLAGLWVNDNEDVRPVRDDAAYEKYGRCLREAASIARSVDSARSQAVQPIDVVRRQVNSFHKDIYDRLVGVRDDIERELGVWRRKQEAAQRHAQAEAEAKARAERERLERRAQVAEDAGRVEKADALRETAAVVTAPVVAAPVPKLAGVSTTKAYSAKVVDFRALLFAVTNDTSGLLEGLITVDQVRLNSLARSLKDGFRVAGCELVVEEGTRAR